MRAEGTVWFDSQTGGIFEFIHEPPPEQIDPRYLKLGEVLLADDFPYKKGQFEPPNGREYSRNQMMTLGHIANTALQQVRSGPVRPENQFKYEYYDRLHVLGLAPSRALVRTYFGTIWKYREELGVHSGRALGKYSDWTHWHLSNHAKSLYEALSRKRKLRRSDIEKAYLAGDGPSLAFIDDHFGPEPIAVMNESLGFFSTRLTDEDRLIQWGSEAMEANDGYLSAQLINILCRLKRGPSASRIALNVSGGISGFKEKARQALDKRLEEEAIRRAELLQVYLTTFEVELPPRLDEAGEQILAATAAKYLLASALLPDHSEDLHKTLARQSSQAFISALRNVNDNVKTNMTAGHVELTAHEMMLQEVIWPVKGYLDNLKIPASDLNRMRRRRKPTPAQ